MTSLRNDEAGTFFVACIALTLATWRISFTFGAYNSVFFEDILSIWFISIAAFCANVIIGRTQEGISYRTWWGMPFLVLPTVMMTAGLWSENVEAIVNFLPLLLLPSIPYIAYILFSVAAPEASELHNRKLTAALVGIIVFINVLSYCVGTYNYAFLTCDDFQIAGASPPANCWKGDVQN